MAWQVSVAEFLGRFGKVLARFRMRVGTWLEVDAAVTLNAEEKNKE